MKGKRPKVKANKSAPKLEVSIGKIRMENPVMVASGTFGYGKEFQDLVDIKKLGAIVTKSVTLEPREGNPPPRIVETACGMLNAIGLQNNGMVAFVEEEMSHLKALGIPVIVSIAGETTSEFVKLAEMLSGLKGIAGLELNISCPNIRRVTSHESRVTGHGPRATKLIAQDPMATYNVVKAVRRATKLTLITKLSPDVTDITEIAKSAEDAGTDAISLINTFIGMAIDVEDRRPKLGLVTGGLSGPCIKPLALRMVWEVFSAVKVPIIGMGGIMDAKDGLEFIVCGATAIAAGTANLVNPKAPIQILSGIRDYLRRNKIKDIKSLTGSLTVHLGGDQ